MNQAEELYARTTRLQDKHDNTYTLLIKNLTTENVHQFSEQMIALGGRAQLRNVRKHLALVLNGTGSQFKGLLAHLHDRTLAKEVHHALQNMTKPLAPMKWKTHTVRFDKPHLMGVLNVTPDSFSDGGMFYDTNLAIHHAHQMAQAGATIIDIGGESSRPGAQAVPEKEELERVLPIIKALRKDRTFKSLISVDTYKPRVAEACLKAGADLLNDITGFRNPQMIKVAAKFKVPVIVMHMQGTPQTMQENPTYTDVVDDIVAYFRIQIPLLKKAGITNMFIDPGIGFGKTVEHNLSIIKRLSEFKILGYPIVLGTSRKSFIGKISNVEVQHRLYGTLASNIVGIQNGAHVLRVHDVLEHRRALEVYQAIKQI